MTVTWEMSPAGLRGSRRRYLRDIIGLRHRHHDRGLEEHQLRGVHRHALLVRHVLRVIGRLLPVTWMSANAPAADRVAGARLVNLVVDPVAAFRGIADDPSWSTRLARRCRHPIRQPLHLLRASRHANQGAWRPALPVLTVGPTVLLASLVAWLTARAWRVSVAWTTAFSIVIRVQVAFTLATVGFASVAGALLPEYANVDLRNPPFTNMTALLGGMDSEAIRTLAGEIDVGRLRARVAVAGPARCGA